MKMEIRTRLKEEVNFPYGTIGGSPGQDFIRKSDLVDGAYYFGFCRNTQCAKWIAGKNEFVYVRTKFSARFDEVIRHPEDDDGFDLFVPFFRCYPSDIDLVSEDTQ